MDYFMMKIHTYLERDENDFFEMRVFYDSHQAQTAFNRDLEAGKDVSDLRTDKINVGEDGRRTNRWN